jgi:hypothetical protein
MPPSLPLVAVLLAVLRVARDGRFSMLAVLSTLACWPPRLVDLAGADCDAEVDGSLLWLLAVLALVARAVAAGAVDGGATAEEA